MVTRIARTAIRLPRTERDPQGYFLPAKKYRKGDKVELTAEQEERLDKLGALEPKSTSTTSTATKRASKE